MKIKLANIKDENNKPLEIDFPENAKGNVPRLHKINTEEKYSNNVNEDIGISYQLEDGTKESLSAKPDSEKINLDKFNKITSGVGGDGFLSNNQDSNFGESGLNNFANFGKQIANTAGNLIGADSIANVVNMFGPGETEQKGLAADIIALEQWKGQKYKDIHTYDWNSKTTLNRSENAANSAMNDLRGELGKTTGGVGGAMAKATNGNAWAQGAGQILDALTGGASNTNMAGNILGDITGEDISDSAWNTDADELANLNTVTKDTIYTSKPGVRFKAKPEMVQNITNDEESTAVFGSSRYTKDGEIYRNTYGNTLEKFRGEQKSATRLSQIRRLVINSDNNFTKKQSVISLIKDDVPDLASVTMADNKVKWSLTDELFSGFNLSDEEIQLIELLKNKNTFNKSLGYIYIRPFYSPDNKGEEIGFRTFDIPFEFTPKISEGAMQANYQTETLLGRLGQFQIYTGTNLSTLNIELEYIALAPDSLDNENIRSQYGTDAWQYYWTNNRIEAIEMKLRSLVLANYVDSDYLIKPPLVEIHLENAKGADADKIGDLYKYPNGINIENEKAVLSDNVGKSYLQYSTSLSKGKDSNRYKKYIVNSVQIDNISDADILYPSLYGRKFNSNYSDRNNTMYHIDTNGIKGWAGYSRKKGFKATLQLTEVTENFLDLVPDFKAYYDAWNFKAAAADLVNSYVSSSLGISSEIKSVEDTLKSAVNTFKNSMFSDEERLEEFFRRAELFAKLYACSNSTYIKNEKKQYRYYIGKFNNNAAEFSFLKKIEAGNDIEDVTNFDKSFMINNEYYNLGDLSISNYSSKKEDAINSFENIKTLMDSKVAEDDAGLVKTLYGDFLPGYIDKNFLTNEEVVEKIYIPYWEEGKILSSAGKISSVIAFGMGHNIFEVANEYTNKAEKIETNINYDEYSLKIRAYDKNGLSEDLDFFNEEEYFDGHFGVGIENYSYNLQRTAVGFCNIIFNLDESKKYTFNKTIFGESIPNSAKGNKLIKLLKEASEFLKDKTPESITAEGASFKKLGEVYKLLMKIREINNYLLNNPNDFKDLLKKISGASFEENINSENITKIAVYPLSNQDDIYAKTIFSNSEERKLNIKEADELLNNLNNSFKAFSNINDWLKLIGYVGDIFEIEKLKIFFANMKKEFINTSNPEKYNKLVEKDCLLINALTLIGVLKSKNLVGIEPDKNDKSAGIIFPYWYIPSDILDFNIYSGWKDEENFPDIYTISGAPVMDILVYKDEQLITAQKCKVKETNIKVITLKEVLEALCEAYDSSKENFKNLIEENISLIGMNYDELKKINFSSDLTKLYDDFGDELAPNLGPDNRTLDANAIINSIKNFLGKLLPENIQKDNQKLNQFEILCQGTYLKSSIENEFKKLVNNENDKLDYTKEISLENNLGNYEDYQKGVDISNNKDYFCYKINKEYALKELNFKNAKSKIKKDEEEAGHGDIYKRYLAMSKNEELVKQFENSKTTVALENYNALTT